MVTTEASPDGGGNTAQYDDGRDELGRLPEPLDAAHYPPVEGGPAIIIPGMPLGQRAGTGPVISSPPPEPVPEPEEPESEPEPAPDAPAADPPAPAAKASKAGGMTTMPRAGG